MSTFTLQMSWPPLLFSTYHNFRQFPEMADLSMHSGVGQFDARNDEVRLRKGTWISVSLCRWNTSRTTSGFPLSCCCRPASSTHPMLSSSLLREERCDNKQNDKNSTTKALFPTSPGGRHHLRTTRARRPAAQRREAGSNLNSGQLFQHHPEHAQLLGNQNVLL